MAGNERAIAFPYPPRCDHIQQLQEHHAESLTAEEAHEQGN
ncbi:MULTISPECIES: hypothetical protein [unclassified Coleofasciculus]|nr:MULTISPECIES: hypothetical protein [unclassified Coleofasciculus]